ncbi:TPA: hypothetical protein DIV55_01215, partial [Patescibacteria group bacterium]|nr:hypothetical protein [Patescibacteria group bacterium]
MKKVFIFLIVATIFLQRIHVIHAADYSSYIYEKQVIKNLPDLTSNQYKLKLESEVQKTITAGGRLDPLYQDQGITGAKYYFGYPGEELLNLCQAYLYLSSTLKSSTSTYIKNQLSAYSPLSVAYYPTGWGDNIDLTKGIRREYYPFVRDLPLNVWPPTAVPVTSIYVVWNCADALSDLAFANTNWNSIQSTYDSFISSGSAVDTYPKLLGLIGYVRLANLTNHTTNVAAAVDKINTASVVLTSFRNTITIGKTYFETTFNHDWSIPLFYTSRPNNQVVTLFGPEAGRFLGNEVENQVKQVFDIIYPYMPQWYMYKGDYGGVGNADASGSHVVKGLELNWFLGSGYSENNLFSPEVPWTYYLIKAYVYKANTSELAKYLDVPYAKRGDLYYMSKLVTLLNTYGQTCWTDTRSGAETWILSSISV